MSHGTGPSVQVTAHPRSRGEHRRSSVPSRRQTGSSPLARGTCRRDAPGRRAGRLIPARAGNMAGNFDKVAVSAAHPRSRGEHHCPASEWKARCGSSPLARGTSGRLFSDLEGRRLIPARAGNMTAPRTVWGSSPAHPRSRGEHSGIRHLSRSTCGSSPLARGT